MKSLFKEDLTKKIIQNLCVFFLGLLFFYLFFEINYLKTIKVINETEKLEKVYKKDKKRATVEAVKKVYGTNNLVVTYYDCLNQNNLVELLGYSLKRKHEFVPEKVRAPKSELESIYIIYGKDVSNRCGQVVVRIDRTIYEEFQTHVEEAMRNKTPLPYTLASPLKNYRYKHFFLGLFLTCFFFLFFSELLIFMPIDEIRSALEEKIINCEVSKDDEALKYEVALSFIGIFTKLLFIVRLFFLLLALVL